MSVKWKVHMALFMVSLIYGATFTIAKEVMPVYVKPFGLIFMRVSVAALGLFIFHRLFIKEKIRDKKDYLSLLIASIFGVGANMLLFFKGLSLTKPINGAVLMLNTPVFVSIFAMIWMKERMTYIKFVGILLATFGALFLITGFSFQFDLETAYGDFLVSLNAIIYAFYLVYIKKLMQKYHPITITLYCFLMGWVIVLPFGFNEFMSVDFHLIAPQIWIYIAFITIGATFFTYILNAFALKHASSGLVGSYIYLQPVLASIIAGISGKDSIDFSRFVSMLLVFVGVYLLSLKTIPLNQQTNES